MTAKIPGWQPPLDHEPHTFTLSPDSTWLCICGLAETHHIHLGISSATCTYTCHAPRADRREAPAVTAPDQPGLRNPVTQPTSGNDLRDRIADAIRKTVPISGPATDAVMAVVQPELDVKDAENAGWRDTTRRYNEASEEWRKRAEAAEAEAAKQFADADRLDQLLIDERAITARLGRELAALRALHQQIGDQ